MDAIFMTGFPGFLGSALLERLLRRERDTAIVCLIQPKFRALAEQRLQQLVGAGQRVELIEGDITLPDFGVGPRIAQLAPHCREIYHLAAVYDLGVDRSLAMRVNVDGTRHLLAFAEGCSGLERLHYVSTCYVSGRYEGVYGESDLAVGQRFNNYYESTKYLAEVEVQVALRQGVPVTIYRPAIVVGDRHSGATQKFDGPYYLLQFVARQPPVAVVPVFGKPGQYTMNIVPRDYVIDAIDYLSKLPQAIGNVYQLADPAPLTIDALITLVEQTLDRRVLRVPVSRRALKWAIDDLPPLQSLLRIEANSLDYFNHPTQYSSSNSRRDLAAAGIVCPPLPSYFDVLTRFWRSNRQIGAQAMV